jgi:uncharacterized protein YodC (DUF2158 family)
MANTEFKVGDIVQLKSGGPEMTITNPNAYGYKIECYWFAGKKQESANFPPDSLKRVEAKQSAA